MSDVAWIAAIIAQFIGVSLSAVAFWALSRASPEVALNRQLVIPFVITYLLFVIALFTLLREPLWIIPALDYLWELFGGSKGTTGWRDKFTVISLYVDAGCLAWLVNRSGGTKHPTESIFTPIFIILPHLTVTFLRPIPNARLNILVIASLTGVAYIFNYKYAPNVTIDPILAQQYRNFVVLVVVVSMVHSVIWPLIL